MGSKRKLVDSILARMPPASEINRYYEPFLGSAAVFLRYAPTQAVLGDNNPDLMNTWEHIRNRPQEIWRAVDNIPVTSHDYYAIRQLHQTNKDSFTRAVHFLYLNRNCFNGVYRTNRKNHFNVPFGQNTGALPPQGSFERCASLFASAQLVTGDFAKTVEAAGAGDVVYLDPPWPALRANYGEYGYASAAPAVTRMPEVIDLLVERGADVYVSLPATYRSHFKPRISAEFALTYSVASRADYRRPTSEVLLVAGDRAIQAATSA